MTERQTSPQGPLQDAPAGSRDSHARLVVFRLTDRELCFPLPVVSEILPMVAITEVPETPSWLPGAITLRGTTLPVVDLRERFGLPHLEIDPDAAIVVTAPRTRDPVGFIVDRVLEVLTLPEKAIDPVDALGGKDQPVEALARYDGRLIVILDVDRLASDVPDLTLPESIT